MDREICPNCGSEDTEFVQLGGSNSTTTVTSEEDVGDGLLELRCCDNCGAGIENILNVESQKVIRSP
jgi:uncharacterized Zn finger protein